MVDFRDDFSQYAVSKLPTFRDDFAKYVDQPSADLAWVPVDIARSRVNIATDVLDLDILRDNTNDAIAHDLGSTISDSNWVLRFKLTIDTLNQQALQTQGYFGLFDQDQIAGEETVQSGIGVVLTCFTGTLTYRLFSAENEFIGAGSSTIFTHALAVETVYVEIKRNSKTSYVVTLYSDASYSTIIESQQGITTSGIFDLRYIGMKNNMSMTVSSSILGSMDDVEFWDSGKQIIFQDDFSSSVGWVPVANDVGGVSVTGGQLTGWGSDGGITREIFYDLPVNKGVTISDTKWIAEFDFQWTSPSTSTNPGHTPFTLSDSTATTDSFQTAGPATPSVPHPRSISMGVNNHNAFNIDRGVQIIVKDTTTTASSSGVSGLAGIIDLDGFANTTVYPRLERLTATTYRLSVFTDPARTTHVTGTASGADSPVTLTATQVVTSTNFIHSSNNSAGGAGRVLTGFLDNLVIKGEERIGATEGAVTFEDDFTTDKFTNGGGTKLTVNTGTQVFDYDCDTDGVSDWEFVDLEAILGTPVDSTNWTLRFRNKVNTTASRTTTSSQLIVGIFDVNTDPSTSQDGIGMKFVASTPLPINFRISGWDNEVVTSTAGVDQLFSTTIDAGDDLFIEIKRLSLTEIQGTLYSDSTYRDIVERINLTIPSTLTDLRYLRIADELQTDATARVEGFIDNIEFYNGASVSKTPVKTKIEDLKDRFWEDNWDDAHASSGVNTSTQVIDYTFSTTNQNEAMVFDLEKVLGVGNVANPNKWALRFKFAILGSVPSSANIFYVGLNSTDELVDSTAPQHGVNIAIMDATGGVQGYRAYDWDNQIPNVTGHDSQEISNPFVLGTDYYVELKRTSATTYECQVFTDPDYTNPFGARITGILTTTAGLRYIKILNIDTATVQTLTGIIDDVQFWNGDEAVEHRAKWVEVDE